MKKIPTLFVRDPDNMKLVTDKVTKGLEWVLEGRCIAREKLDGTACAILGGRLYKRFTAQLESPTEEGVAPPDGFIPADSAHRYSGKQPGWVLVGDGLEDKWHREARDNSAYTYLPDGTYELVGSKVQGGPYSYEHHHLIRHENAAIVPIADLSFKGLKAKLSEKCPRTESQVIMEGFVFWGPEGPVCKIKRRDFGLPWPVKEA